MCAKWSGGSKRLQGHEVVGSYPDSRLSMQLLLQYRTENAFPEFVIMTAGLMQPVGHLGGNFRCRDELAM